MRHASRPSLRASRFAGGLLLAMLLGACGSGGPADVGSAVSSGVTLVGANASDQETRADPSSAEDGTATVEDASADETPANEAPADASQDPSVAAAGEPTSLGTFRPTLPYRYDRVVVGEDHVLVGEPTDPSDDTYVGSVHVHARAGDGTAGEAFAIEPPEDAVDAFGEHLGLDGTTLAATGNRHDPATDAREAVVYLYELTDGGAGPPIRTLLEGDGIRPGSLTLTLRDGLLAVGHRPSFSDRDAEGGGFPVGAAVRLFERDAGGANAWGEVDPLSAPDRDDGREGGFGADIAVAPGGTLLAVADTAQESDAGFGSYVFLFQRAAPGEPWDLIRTFRDEELPSPYSAMLEVDHDTLVVTPMALRETSSAEVAIFHRDAGGPDGWGPAATVTVEVSTPPDEAIPRHVLLASDLANDTLVVGIGPSGCIDLREDAGSGPAPCAGGRVHVLGATDDPSVWDTRQVVDDPTGAGRSSYGEYVAIGPDGEAVVAGGVVLPDEGAAYTHLDLYVRQAQTAAANPGRH